MRAFCVSPWRHADDIEFVELASARQNWGTRSTTITMMEVVVEWSVLLSCGEVVMMEVEVVWRWRW